MRICVSFFLVLFSTQVLFADSTLRQNPDYLQSLKFDTPQDLLISERLLKDALNLEPANPDYHFELSRVYAAYYDALRTKKFSEAQKYLMLSERSLNQVLMVRPFDVAARYNLAVVYKRKWQMEKARMEFRNVLERIDKDEQPFVAASALMQIGSIYEDQGFFQEARDAYREARRYDYHNSTIVSALEEVKLREEAYRNYASGRRPDTRYVSAADHVQYGRQIALSGERNIGGLGALSFMSAYLFQQFLSKKQSGEEQFEQ